MSDAANFEAVAWSYSSNIPGMLADFRHSASYLYSGALALVYAVTGRQPLLLQAISVGAGVACVWRTWALIGELWADEAVPETTWLLALMPTAVMYSALTMREMFFAFFLLQASFHVVRWLRLGNWKSLVCVYLCIAAGVFFHGGMLVAGVTITALLMLDAARKLRHNQKMLPADLLAIGVCAFCAVLIALALIYNPSLPKLGKVHELLSWTPYLHGFDDRMIGSGAYPAFIDAASPPQLLYIIPLRIFYLLFSPFVWDVSQLRHLAGTFDGMVHLACAIVIALNFNAIRQNRPAMWLLVILLSLVLAFSFGTGNFGAAIRHRSKLFPLMLVLISSRTLYLQYFSNYRSRAVHDR